jgi:hypothetical protein
MAVLPPPPLRANVGDYPWLDWYNKLHAYVGSTDSISWAVIDKAGSSLADIADHSHALLSGMQGGVPGERYHLTNAQYTNAINVPAYTTLVVTTGSYANPSWITSLATTKLTGTITNAQLANSTISGVSLGSNLFALSIGTGLTGTSYNGSSAVSLGFSVPAVGTWAATPSSANLAAAMTDETGSGALVFANAPTMSAVTIDGANPYIQFNNGSAVALAAGRVWYDGANGSWNLGMGGGNITQQVGEELFIYGKASAAITDSPLQIVYHTGTVGASGVIRFAPTVAGITDENAIIGVATESIALNAFGRITSFGVIHGINTTGSAFGETWADDDVIWYNPVTGNPTKFKPSAPNIKIQVGIVINAGTGGSGSFQVLLQPGTQLGGTDSNVQITSAANNNLLQYDATAGYWKNVATIPNSNLANSSITINGTAISLGGSVSVGTVTSVAALTLGTSGTDLSSTVATGTTTPVITLNVPTASATTRGALSAADWTTFNNKGSGSVTSVSGTGTVNGLTLTGTVTTSGSLTLGGTLSGIANSALTNSSVTVTAGTGMSGGGTVALGGTITLTNAGVTSVNGSTGAITGVVKNTFTSIAGNPTATDIPAGQWAVYKNTTTGAIAIWVNDGGTLSRVVATAAAA